MNLNYTRLGVLLLRIQGVILVAQSIPRLAMAIPTLFQSAKFSKLGVLNHDIFILFQPIIGVLLFVFSIPIAQKAVGFLDQKNGD